MELTFRDLWDLSTFCEKLPDNETLFIFDYTESYKTTVLIIKVILRKLGWDYREIVVHHYDSIGVVVKQNHETIVKLTEEFGDDRYWEREEEEEKEDTTDEEEEEPKENEDPIQ